MSQEMKYSYIDKSGQITQITEKHNIVGRYNEELALVQEAGKGSGSRYGYVDRSRKLVIGFQFQQAGEFSEGLAAVQIGDKWGFIDKWGQIVIKPQFDDAQRMHDGIGIVSIGNNTFFIDKKGEKIFSTNTANIDIDMYVAHYSEGLIAASNGGDTKKGFIDKTGKFIIAPVFDDVCDFSEGLARVMMIQDNEQKVGFIDHSGQFVIPPIYNGDGDFRRNSTDFSEGLASLTENGRPTVTEAGAYIYIDKNGKVILSTNFFSAGQFHEGLAVVYDNKKKKRGFIDRTGKIVIPLQYDFAGDFYEGIAYVGTLQ